VVVVSEEVVVEFNGISTAVYSTSSISMAMVCEVEVEVEVEEAIEVVRSGY
jgi:hypothetical protein